MSRANVVLIVFMFWLAIVMAGVGYHYYSASPPSLAGTRRVVAMETDGVAAPADFVNKIQWRFEKGFLMIKGITPTGEVPCRVTLNQDVKACTFNDQELGIELAVRGIYMAKLPVATGLLRRPVTESLRKWSYPWRQSNTSVPSATQRWSRG